MARLAQMPLFAAVIGLSWLALSLGGCTPLNARKVDHHDKPRIAFVMASHRNESFITIADAAKGHQGAHADQYVLVSDGAMDEPDASRQVGLMEQLAATQVDAIVIVPSDATCGVTVCKRAIELGMPVVSILNPLGGEVLESAEVQVPFIGPDNRKGARMVGDYLAQHLHVGDGVGILEVASPHFNTEQRRIGFEEAMKSAGMKVVSVQNELWGVEKSYDIVSAMLNEHPALKAVLCTDGNAALGAAAAARAAGRSDQLAIVGFGNSPAVCEAIRDGRILATADEHVDQVVALGIELALQILQGRPLPFPRETAIDLVTRENLQ